MPKTDFSCVRVKKYGASSIGASERHNERKNDTYSNINVDPERIPYNVHFKDPGDRTYMEILTEMEEKGMVSRRGLRPDATFFDELVFDVNTMYFDRHGGYEYAKQFYEEAYHFLEKKFGSDYILSAVMHADEINKAATDELGIPTYHYHMHAVVVPVVDKEIRWSKRCKDPELRGTVKEVIHQISHSKKWASTEPMTDDCGEPVFRSNGKPKYRPSYSLLQDEFIDHMRDAGYRDFERGALGSTSEHLTSLQYQIKKDTERLAAIVEKSTSMEIQVDTLQEAIDSKVLEYQRADVDYVDHYDVNRIEPISNGNGMISVYREDFEFMRDLANEGVSGRRKIQQYEREIPELEERYNKLADRFNTLVDQCKPYLVAIQRVPDLVRSLIDKIVDRLGVYGMNYVRNPEPRVKKIEHGKGRNGYER